MTQQSDDRVLQILQEALETRKERNEKYGESCYGGAYKQHGHVMTALFPSGVELKTPSDFNRFGVLNMMVSKLIRECANFGEFGHIDSMRDMAVYSAMMQELDEIRNSRDYDCEISISADEMTIKKETVNSSIENAISQKVND